MIKHNPTANRKVKADSIEVWKAEIIEKEHIKELLDKIRAEIEQDAFNDVNGSKFISVNRVNQIIDKCKAESEE